MERDTKIALAAFGSGIIALSLVYLFDAERKREAHTKAFLSQVKPGAVVEVCNCSVYVALEARRRTFPRVINNTEDHNVAYENRMEFVERPFIVYEENPSPTERTWISYPDPKTGRLIYLALNKDTDKFFTVGSHTNQPGLLDLLPGLRQKVSISEIIAEDGNSRLRRISTKDFGRPTALANASKLY